MSLSRPSPERFDTSARSSSSMLQGQSFVPSPVFAAHDTPTSEQGSYILFAIIGTTYYLGV